MGNSVVLKPSEKSPLSAIRLAEIAMEAGIPAGVFNVVPGFGKQAGEPLALHMNVDGLVFTGSTAVGKQLLQCAGRSNLKRAYMECGGKSPNLVFADAQDLDKAAEAAASGIFYNQGEVCTAASRLLVERSIKDEFVARVVEAGRKMQPRHPFEPGAPMGAMVDETQTSRVLGYIEKGVAEGARLVLGGKRADTVPGGSYIEPTVFDEVAHEHTISREEIFGPVLSVIAFDDEEQALRMANDTEYGLAAGVWTQDISRAHRVARKLRAGSVWVNYWDGGDMTAPFGGYKQSGNGRDKSLHAFDLDQSGRLIRATPPGGRRRKDASTCPFPDRHRSRGDERRIGGGPAPDGLVGRMRDRRGHCAWRRHAARCAAGTPPAELDRASQLSGDSVGRRAGHHIGGADDEAPAHQFSRAGWARAGRIHRGRLRYRQGTASALVDHPGQRDDHRNVRRRAA
jgi:hypothetical protein